MTQKNTTRRRYWARTIPAEMVALLRQVKEVSSRTREIRPHQAFGPRTVDELRHFTASA